MTRAMRSVAGELQAPLGIVLEGGYSLSALAASVRATLSAMQEPETATVPQAALVPEAVAARERLTQWWPDLGD